MPVTPKDNSTALDASTPLAASLTNVLFASVGTGVIWNGIPFIAKHDYEFSKRENLVLYITIGAIYVVAALAAGPITRRLKRWLSPRGVLVTLHLLLAASCAGPILIDSKWVLWAVAGINSLLSAFLWPLIESYITAGRHGKDMRRAIGWFNIVWTGAVAAGMILMAPVVEEHARLAIVGLGGLYVAGLLPLVWFTPMPGAHDEAMSIASVGSEYPMLLQSARVLLPLSYVLNSALSPLLPFLFQRIQMDVLWETPATATWMVMRVAVMLVMSRVGFWHGRWGTLLLGAGLMSGGFALIVLGPALPIMLVGFAGFGVGLGIVYYAALYYAMTVGRAEIDAGGRHESLIGVGYTIGPVAVLFGLQAGRDTGGTEIATAEGIAIVTSVWILIGLGSLLALRPYLGARRSRASTRAEATHR